MLVNIVYYFLFLVVKIKKNIMPQSLVYNRAIKQLIQNGISYGSIMPGRHLLSFDSDSWDIYFETPGKYKYIDIYL